MGEGAFRLVEVVHPPLKKTTTKIRVTVERSAFI
jgi:hypothetical protein